MSTVLENVVFKLGIGPCPHKKGAVVHIGYTDELPSITGDTTRYYDGFCNDCKEQVYGRIGGMKPAIPWTTDRNLAFSPAPTYETILNPLK